MYVQHEEAYFGQQQTAQITKLVIYVLEPNSKSTRFHLEPRPSATDLLLTAF